MIDTRALADMSYGLFIIGARKGEKFNAMIANSVFQVTAEPPKIAIALNKNSLTHDYIKATGLFCVQAIEQGADMLFIGNFGFRTGKDYDKFAKVSYKLSAQGLPIVLDNTLSWMSVKVNQVIDLGTHTMFIGLVEDTQVIKEGKPLTYDYYQCVLRGKTPRGATTFKENKEK
ncbi:MAG: flavin reductase [Elusimicrobiaceae bacterium]|nr:flavin reductase [Elusimicrobiaceae bacterium]MBQ6223846.1 flavin reductase [Campylobacter sp.]